MLLIPDPTTAYADPFYVPPHPCSQLFHQGSDQR